MKKVVTFLLTLLMVFLNVQKSTAQSLQNNTLNSVASFSFFEEEASLFTNDASFLETSNNLNFVEETSDDTENTTTVLTPLTDANIQTAVNDWVADPTAATATYGHISNWDVSNVTYMRYLFSYKTTFNDDISSWDVSNVTHIGSMFNNAINFNQDISSWNVSKVTSMSFMFLDAKSFNQDIGNWNVSKVTDMSSMFRRISSGALSFNQDIRSWDVSNVSKMAFMFTNNDAFKYTLNDWCVTNMFNEPSFSNKIEDVYWPFWGTCPTTSMEVITTTATNIGLTSVLFAGEVISDGAVSEKGVVYSKTSEDSTPELNEANVNKEVLGSGTGVFSANISGLPDSTNYSYRSYAIRPSGKVSYGELLTFKTTAPITQANIKRY